MSTSNTCSCGHDHSHEHHHHHHDHDHSCGCGGACSSPKDTKLSANHIHFLQHLMHYKYLPVAQFVITSSKESEFEVVALAPVFIRDVKDSMDLVKEAGRFLQTLEDKGMITLDYDIPMQGYAYEEYKCSSVYQHFLDTIKQSKTKENHLGDTANLVLGSMAMTDFAENFIKGLK